METVWKGKQRVKFRDCLYAMSPSIKKVYMRRLPTCCVYGVVRSASIYSHPNYCSSRTFIQKQMMLGIAPTNDAPSPWWWDLRECWPKEGPWYATNSTSCNVSFIPTSVCVCVCGQAPIGPPIQINSGFSLLQFPSTLPHFNLQWPLLFFL